MTRPVPRREPRYWLKEGAFAACSLLSRLDRSSATPPRVILTYHSHTARGRWGIDVGEFERQVSYVASRFRLVRVSALLDQPRNHQGEPIACLTFDDGYLDNYELTLPILERFGVKGTFFLVPSLLGGELRTSQGHEPVLNREHAREIASLGHEVGSHTMTHRVLTDMPLDEARSEVTESKRALEDLLGVAVESFSYPLGKFNEAVKALPRTAGYRLAVTTREALVPDEPDWFAVPRVSVDRSVGSIQFRAKLTRGLDVYNRLREGRRGDRTTTALGNASSARGPADVPDAP